MTNRLVKVDRVASADEAAALEALGVGVIGCDLDPDPRFADNRTVDPNQADQIRKALRHAKFAVALDARADPAQVVNIARLTGADLIQPITSAIPPHSVRTALRAAAIGIVYAGIEIAHDDDPGWLFDAHDGTPDLNAALFQVDVLPEYAGAWAFLRDKSPEYEQEFQVEDLDELGRDRVLIANLDVTPGNVGEILARLPHLHGLALTLGQKTTRDDVHFHQFADTVKILERMRDDAGGEPGLSRSDTSQ